VKLLPDDYSSLTSKLESQAESSGLILKDKDAIEEEEMNQLLKRLNLNDEEYELLLKKVKRDKAAKQKVSQEQLKNFSPGSPEKGLPAQYLQEESKTEKPSIEDIEERKSQKTIATEPREVIGAHSFTAHELLGTGSFGEVYLVEKLSDQILHAMKVLPKDKIK